MKKIEVVIASTNFDVHGEQLLKEDLAELFHQLNGNRAILCIEHDTSNPTVGYVENFKLVEKQGESYLCGDKYVYDEYAELDASKIGMSYSMPKPIKTTPTAIVSIYLPFPHYNDKSLIDELSNEYVESGKWIKKSADLTTTVLITSGLIWLFGKVANDAYNSIVQPLLKPIFDRIGNIGISFVYDFHQPCYDDFGNVVDIVFPKLKQQYLENADSVIESGMKLVEAVLKSDRNSNDDPIARIRMKNEESKFIPAEAIRSSGNIETLTN